MKKILLVLLAILLAFAMIACDDTTDDTKDSTNENSTSSTDSGDNSDPTLPDGDNTGDSSNTDDSNNTDNSGSGDNGNEDKEQGSVLANAIIKQFEDAASMKLEFSLEVVNTEEYWELADDEELAKNTDYLHGIANFVLVAAKTENGVNLKIDALIKSDYGEGFETDAEMTVLYIIDGVMYQYDSYYEGYVATEIPAVDTTEIEAIVGEIINSTGLTEDDFNAMLGQLGESFIYVFNVIDNKGTISADFKPIYDALVAYLDGINPEEYTVEDILNDILALVDETLTADALVEIMAQTLDLTVAEYLTVLDTALQETYGMTLNEAIATITNDETVQLALAEIMLANGVSEDEIVENLEMIKALTIEMIVPAEMMDVKLYDLYIAMMMGDVEIPEGEEIEIPTLEEVVAMINAILDMTLAEAEENLEIPFSTILAIPELLVLNACDFEINVNFEGVFQLVSVEGKFEFDAVASNPSYYDETKMDVNALALTVTFKLYEISNESVEIVLPEDIVIVEPDVGAEELEYHLFEGTEHIGLLKIAEDEGYVFVTVYKYGVMYSAILEYPGFDGTYIVFNGEYMTNEENELIYDGDVIIEIDIENESAYISYSEHAWSTWEDGGDGYYYRVCVNCGVMDDQEA